MTYDLLKKRTYAGYLLKNRRNTYKRSTAIRDKFAVITLGIIIAGLICFACYGVQEAFLSALIS